MTTTPSPSPAPAEGPASPPPASCDSRVLQGVTLRNLLSFGPETPYLPLGNLNVLIGPNASGKSNLLEALALLRSAPGDIRAVISRGGGVGEWIWKGDPHAVATLDAVLTNLEGSQPLRHVLAFQAEQQTFRFQDERIENERPEDGQSEPSFYYRSNQKGRPVLNTREGNERQLRRLHGESVQAEESILRQFRDPERYPELAHLTGLYERIRLYREWTFGRNAVFRTPQKADMRNDRLEEDFSNLGLFLNRLCRQPKVKGTLLDGLRDLYAEFGDIHINIEAGTVQVFFVEGDFTIPATRLSDGSLRYLCLLAILCDPDPPPLIGLEEPELGLHPDLITKVADLLVKTSERTQLVVTTHSDILVDALTEEPEALVICGKRQGSTTLHRLTREEVEPWVEQNRLGQLWMQGQLGGTRW